LWGNNNSEENNGINKSETIGATKYIKNEYKEVVKILRERHKDLLPVGGNKTSFIFN